MKKIFRLWIAADEARRAFMTEPCDVNLRRWLYYQDRYRAFRDAMEASR